MPVRMASPSLADADPLADAVVTGGNANQVIYLPKMDKVIGTLDYVDVIAGGHAGSLREDGTFGEVSMNSFNHYAFGSIAEWMYQCMCGIQPDENAPGFKHAWIRPQPNSLIQHAKASTLTPYGHLGCGWRIEGEMLHMTVDVPCNAKVSIALPDAADADVMENGVSIGAQGVMERGSGRWEYVYRFTGEEIHKRV